MATIKQIDANRRNAQHSTGPITPEGKQSSSRNALQSGIYAEKEALPFEDAEALKTLTAEYHSRFHPTTPEARALVDSLVHHEWLLRRLRRAEACIYQCDCPACEIYEGKSEAAVTSRRLRCELSKFDHLQRRINATERNYHRSLKALQALQPPAGPVQPEEPKPTSGKLASFPENHPEPEPEAQPGPAGPPEKAAPTDSSLLAADSWRSPGRTLLKPAPVGGPLIRGRQGARSGFHKRSPAHSAESFPRPLTRGPLFDLAQPLAAPPRAAAAPEI